jgi:hypothetical protein
MSVFWSLSHFLKTWISKAVSMWVRFTPRNMSDRLSLSVHVSSSTRGEIVKIFRILILKISKRTGTNCFFNRVSQDQSTCPSRLTAVTCRKLLLLMLFSGIHCKIALFCGNSSDKLCIYYKTWIRQGNTKLWIIILHSVHSFLLNFNPIII